MLSLKVLMLLGITLKAQYSVRSTRSDWVNEYDGRMDWSTPGKNQMITGLYSKHNNRREDRIWKFYYGSASRGVQCNSKYWASYQNGWDSPLSFSCPANQAISGFQSTHHNHREDRRWKIQCCKVTNAQLIDMGFTGYLNSWDGLLDYKCADDEVLAGVYSVHNNHREDRRWKVKCARLRPVANLLIASKLSGWENSYDRALEFDAGVDGMITGLYSVHNNRREDRIWKVRYGSAAGVDCQEQKWTNWRNGFDSVLSFTCPTNQVLHGIESYHNNHREDRRWKFQCCRVSSRVSVQRKGWTGYVNDWDRELNYRCPSSDQAIVGLYSYHNNHREDRRWKVRCGQLIRK